MKAGSSTSHKIRKAIDRFVKLLKPTETSMSPKSNDEKISAARVTDEAGNEYLCPTRELKDPNFVRETEKMNCVPYNSLSTKVIE